ncbi:MAG: phosphatase PAP2 family protein [Phycisphaerae bacterium]|nr:phosphatase PAP2 family protein [Phycisphaerae bacterium]
MRYSVVSLSYNHPPAASSTFSITQQLHWMSQSRRKPLSRQELHGLKAIVHNDQPDGGPWSRPSGHTSSAVAVASVLHEFYGWKVGLPAYAGAGLVAWRMMDEGDHWAGDVLFGAVLGWVVGHTVAGRHGSAEIAGFELLPYYGNYQTPAAGISLARRF